MQEREDEQIVLSTLLIELQQIQGYIDDILDYQVTILDSAHRIIEMSDLPDEEFSDREVTLMVQHQNWFSTPSNSAAPRLNSVIARGDISLISNRELRYRLLDQPDRFGWIRGSLQDDFDFSKNVLEPFLYQNASYVHLIAESTQRPGASGTVFPGIPVTPSDEFSHRDLVRNRIFLNMIIARTALLEDIVSLGRTPGLEEDVGSVVQLIESELR